MHSITINELKYAREKIHLSWKCGDGRLHKNFRFRCVDTFKDDDNNGDDDNEDDDDNDGDNNGDNDGDNGGDDYSNNYGDDGGDDDEESIGETRRQLSQGYNYPWGARMQSMLASKMIMMRIRIRIRMTMIMIMVSMGIMRRRRRKLWCNLSICEKNMQKSFKISTWLQLEVQVWSGTEMNNILHRQAQCRKQDDKYILMNKKSVKDI